jgi:hypothetical protein
MDEIWLKWSISTYLHHFSSVLDVLGLILKGKPVGFAGKGFWGTGTGPGRDTPGLPVLITNVTVNNLPSFGLVSDIFHSIINGETSLHARHSQTI